MWRFSVKSLMSTVFLLQHLQVHSWSSRMSCPHTHYSVCELQLQCWLDLLLHSSLEQWRSSRKINSAWCTDKMLQRADSGYFISFDCVSSPMLSPCHLSLILISHLYLVNICVVTCHNSCWVCSAVGPCSWCSRCFLCLSLRELPQTPLL